ncbi:MAG TPA: MMPL family transporter [Burkholderiales bacterium]|nr:MMPL family transporter [Burkholderiales bacterium]
MAPRPGSRSAFAHPAARYGVALACLCALAVGAWKSLRIETDFGAFLPRSSTLEHRLLISQLREGVVSRLMLIALDGADEQRLAQSSRDLVERLNRAPDFDYAGNGSPERFLEQGEVLMRNRYALSPAVTPDRFTPSALRGALEEQLAQLASPMGMLARRVMARDPTGEFLAVLRELDSGGGPGLRQGVWFSADGRRAFILAQTRAAGFDSAGQAQAMETVRGLAAQAAPGVTLSLTGPGVFAAEARRLIERDARLLSLCSGGFILALMVFAYRSPLAVLVIALPVAFGLLLGMLLVQAVFGSVHALTVAFAATLLGEAVDYPNYLLLNAAHGEPLRAAALRIGRTLALAVLTTVASALALALSGFQGLAQLGVLTMSGILAAGLATRWLLPWLLRVAPAVPRHHVPSLTPTPMLKWASAAVLAALAAAAAWTAAAGSGPWEEDLAALSPVPPGLRELDARLRADMGAAEAGVFMASAGASAEAALVEAERIRPLLERWKADRRISGYDSPSSLLPARDTQMRRLAALPEPAALEAELRGALRGLPFRPDAFAPFVRDVAMARGQAPVSRASYDGTPFGAKLRAQVIELDGQWLAVTTLSGVADAAQLAQAAQREAGSASSLIDLKRISTRMVDGYRDDALRQTGLGALIILALLAAGLRSPARALRVAAPAAAGLAATAALLVLAGVKLSVFHLVALLLVLGVGLNYALFFERPPQDEEERRRSRLSLAVCALSTIATFGFMSLSSTPVLHALGATVALGALLCLAFSALWSPSALSIGHPWAA